MSSLEELFKSFTLTAFRFEALPSYSIPAEVGILEAYGRKESTPPVPEGEWAEWLASLKQWTHDGKKVRRVRLLPRESTQYLNCELDWIYPINVNAGEDIRMISEAEVLSLLGEIPSDFWLFDSKSVALMKYSQRGEWAGSTVLESTTRVYATTAKQLWDAAVPFPTT